MPRWNLDGDSLVYTVLRQDRVFVMMHPIFGKPNVLIEKNNMLLGGAWSLDGNSIVVTETKNGNADLYHFLFSKKKYIRLTNHPAIDTSPSFSPDGKTLMFVSDRSGTKQIYTLDMKSKAVFRLTFGSGSNTDPAWSPNGALISYTRRRLRSQIYIMTPDGDKKRLLTSGKFDSEQASWSPDGRQLVFSSNKEGEEKLYVIFIDGSGMRRLTNTPKYFREQSPSWNIRHFD